MFPFSFEWIWDMGHMVFFGGLWYAVGILSAGMLYVILKAAWDTMSESTNNSGESH